MYIRSCRISIINSLCMFVHTLGRSPKVQSLSSAAKYNLANSNSGAYKQSIATLMAWSYYTMPYIYHIKIQQTIVYPFMALFELPWTSKYLGLQGKFRRRAEEPIPWRRGESQEKNGEAGAT